MSASAARAHQVPAIVPAKDGHGRTYVRTLLVFLCVHEKSTRCITIFSNYGAPLRRRPARKLRYNKNMLSELDTRLER